MSPGSVPAPSGVPPTTRHVPSASGRARTPRTTARRRRTGARSGWQHHVPGAAAARQRDLLRLPQPRRRRAPEPHEVEPMSVVATRPPGRKTAWCAREGRSRMPSSTRLRADPRRTTARGARTPRRPRRAARGRRRRGRCRPRRRGGEPPAGRRGRPPPAAITGEHGRPAASSVIRTTRPSPQQAGDERAAVGCDRDVARRLARVDALAERDEGRLARPPERLHGARASSAA